MFTYAYPGRLPRLNKITCRQASLPGAGLEERVGEAKKMPVGLLGELVPQKPSAVNPMHVQIKGPCPIYLTRGTMEHTTSTGEHVCPGAHSAATV